MSVRKKRILEETEKLLRENHVTRPPVPVERIAKRLPAKLHYSPLDDELSGMVYVKDGTPIIGVNSLHHPNRRRFTVAHECGHFILHRVHITKEIHVDKVFPMLRRDPLSAAGVDEREMEANLFAAELLMPRKFLIDALAGLSRSLLDLDIDDEDTVNALAQRFKVSPSAMRYRLNGLYS